VRPSISVGREFGDVAPISIVLDLMNPAWTRGRIVGRRRLARFDEAKRTTHHQCSWDVVKALGGGGQLGGVVPLQPLAPPVL
jgi:hypothetical protein